MARIPEEEIRAYGLTEAKLRSHLINTCVNPTIASKTVVSEEFVPQGEDMTVLVREIEIDIGLTKRVNVYVEKSESGFKCPGLIGSLIVATFGARYSALDGLSPLIDITSEMTRAITMDKDKLAAIGIDGIYQLNEGRIVTWGEWIERFKQWEEKAMSGSGTEQ